MADKGDKVFYEPERELYLYDYTGFSYLNYLFCDLADSSRMSERPLIESRIPLYLLLQFLLYVDGVRYSWSDLFENFLSY